MGFINNFHLLLLLFLLVTATKQARSQNKSIETSEEILLFAIPSGALGSTLVVDDKKGTFLKKSIVPISLIATGVLFSGSRFEKSLQSDLWDAVGKGFRLGIDDYTRYVPIAQLYVSDLFGVKAKNHWFDQSKNLALSVVLTDLITTRLKRATNKTRPNGGNDMESFPSAHTSLAFTTAAILNKEFRDSSPWLAYSGYAFATTTGVFRILNNQHWLSDVMVGAGIGILVTELVYHFDYLFAWNPFKKSKDTVLMPRYSESGLRLYFSKNF